MIQAWGGNRVFLSVHEHESLGEEDGAYLMRYNVVRIGEGE